jgi:hypothetical protein
MKKLLSFLAMALLFVACQNDPGNGIAEKDLVTARFGVSAGELATRADDAATGFSSALGAIGNFSEADWAKYNLRFTFEVYNKDDNGSGTPIAKERQVSVVDKYEEGDEVFFEVRLVPNKEYKFVVFADFVENGTTVENVTDLFYNTADLRNITMIDGKMDPMNEARDAYFVSKNLLIKTSIEEPLRLSRPFGKIRVVTNDIEYIEKYAAPVKAEITYKNLPIYKSFNAVNGQISTERSGDAEISFEYELGKNLLYTKGRDGEASDMTLFADYLLALPEGQSEINFLLSVYDENDNLIKSNDFTGQIPIERNHLTTIEGSLLTTKANIKVIVDSEFADKEYVIDNIWDGDYMELPEANENGVVEITEAGELATLFTEGSDDKIKVELTDNFNFDGYVIEPVVDMNKFKNIEINGNNKTISNLVINGAETRANGGVAALFPVVVGAKIENLVISNITVDAGEGENAYAAALIGKSFGLVELNNIVVENSTIKGTNKVGGLVASVMENNIIATNCGVNNVIIETYDVEDESGLAGGLIGYIACSGDSKIAESRIENCFVTNSTLNVINSRGNNERANSEFIGGIAGDKGDILLINDATIEDNKFNETGAEEYTSPYGSFIGGTRGDFKVYIDNVMVGKLEKPVVEAAVEGNVITLTWEAIDGAEAYSITNGTEMPVVVETTEYSFTGEYETKYTFYVVALPKNEDINTPSDAAEVSATTEEEPARKVTVAEFLAAAEDSTMYELTGVITSVTNTTYGNFYLKDETAEVLIYGLCSPTGAQKYWAASGAKVGDTITVQTVRTSYNGAPQGKNALFVELVPFVAEKSEWGVVGDLTSWGNNDIAMYTTWHTKNLFVAYNVEITSGAFKIRANNQWNDAKNYGLEVAGSINPNKYYKVITSGGSQNITPMEYGKYDIYFDLTNKRVALMTPGKAYAEAENGGNPIVVIAGLKDHEWGVVGSFNNWNVANYVTMEVDGDWAVGKNIALTKNAEFKFAADKAWTLSYGTGGNVNIGQTYTTYNNGGNMKYVGDAGNFDIYFSLVDASFYMEPHADKAEYTSTLTFDDKAKRTTFTSSQQIWEENGLTLINDKAASTNAVADYAKPLRCYMGSKITVNANDGEISKIVFDCNSSSYATALKNSIGTTATVSVSSDKVTVTLDDVTEFVVAKLTAQVRMDSITVTYVK